MDSKRLMHGVELATRVLKTKYGRDACTIGKVIKNHHGKVLLETVVGGRRLLESPVGDPTPRIC